MIRIDQHRETLIREAARKRDLRLLFLFGSRAGGQTHWESDFDFGYLSRRDLPIEEEGVFIGELLAISGAKDERLINLVDFKTASPLLLHSALGGAQLLYEERDGDFADLQAYSFKKYVETLPLFRMKAERLGVSQGV